MADETEEETEETEETAAEAAVAAAALKVATVSAHIQNAVERTQEVAVTFEETIKLLQQEALADFSDADFRGDVDKRLTWPFSSDDLSGLADLVNQDLPETTILSWSSPPDIGEAPTINIRMANDVTVPNSAITAPQINIPDTPKIDFPEPPTVSGDPQSPVIPPTPVYVMPEAPEFAAVVLPQTPLVEIPTLDVTAPDSTLEEPTVQFEFSEGEYESAILAATKTNLLDDLTYGTYGIKAEVEEDLWNRARDREARIYNDTISQGASGLASRGFSLPNGALLNLIEKATEKSSAAMSDINRDISIKRADMFVAARQFTIQTGLNLEQVLINLHQGRYGRVLDASRALSEFGIAQYNARVQRLNAQLGVYQAEAQVFESRIKGAISATEVYKVQMEGAKVDLDARRAMLDIYNSKISAIKILQEIYSSQMAGAKLFVDIESAKLDGKKTQAQIYQATVQGRVAELNASKVALEGELAKVEVYKAQISAENTVVSGAKVRADIQRTMVGADSERAKIELEQYRTKMELLKSKLIEEREKVNIIAKNNDLILEKYKTKVAGVENYTRALQQFAASSSDVHSDQTKLFMDAAKLHLTTLESSANIKVDGRKHIADLYSRIVESLNASMSSLVTISAG